MGMIKGTAQRVAEAMSQGLWTAAPDMTLRQAAALMAAEGLGVLTVEDAGGRASGIISSGTVLDAAGRKIGDLPVTAIMEPLHRVCHPADSLESAHALMAALGTPHLPVCDAEGHPIGIISWGEMTPCFGIFHSPIAISFSPAAKGQTRPLH